METEVLTAPAVGGMKLIAKNVFFISQDELKDFYIKFAYLMNPGACSTNRNEFEILNILSKDLRKVIGSLSKFTQHAWEDGVLEIQKTCSIYSMQDSINKQERMRVNRSIGSHLQFLTQMAACNGEMKHAYIEYTRHYKNVEFILTQLRGKEGKKEG